MNLSSKSWKTTSMGISAILVSLIHLWFIRNNITEADCLTALAAILPGVGLLLARDNDKTSEQVGADPITKAAQLHAQANALANSAGGTPTPTPATPPAPLK